jgi:hypothetical protein
LYVFEIPCQWRYGSCFHGFPPRKSTLLYHSIYRANFIANSRIFNALALNLMFTNMIYYAIIYNNAKLI